MEDATSRAYPVPLPVTFYPLQANPAGERLAVGMASSSVENRLYSTDACGTALNQWHAGR
jgi:hypothetical protein